MADILGGNNHEQQSEIHAAERTLLQLLSVNDDDIPWDAVLARLSRYPHEAYFYRRNTPSPLQRALEKNNGCPPLAVVHYLIRTHRGALKHPAYPSSHRRTLLHFACSIGVRAEIIQVLLHEHPAAASRRDFVAGEIPLHLTHDAHTARVLLKSYRAGIAVANWSAGCLPLHSAAKRPDASTDLVRFLIQRGRDCHLGGREGHGGLFVRGHDGKIPLDIVCDEMIRASPQDGQMGSDRKKHLLPHLGEHLSRYWQKLVLIVCEMRRSIQSHNNKPITHHQGNKHFFYITHSLLELNCPTEIIILAIHMRPWEMQRRDQSGRIPLSIAASMPGISTEVIQALVHPEYGFSRGARMADSNGQLPLHLAAASGRKFAGGIESIMLADPRAIGTRDMKDQMFPFMIAAVGESSSIDAVYCLLREKPELLAHFDVVGSCRRVRNNKNKAKIALDLIYNRLTHPKHFISS